MVCGCTKQKDGGLSRKENMRHSRDKVLRDTLREKILDVAENLFAEKGYAETSIREITKKAHCNLSAVNYYFHGKDNLYIEVFHRQMSKVECQDSPSISEVLCEIVGKITLEKLIRTFCNAFLQPFLESGGNNTALKLVMKEQQNPHLPRHIREQLILPAQVEMKRALVKACPGLEDSAADLCIQSILGQLQHLTQTQAMFKGLNGRNKPVVEMAKSIEHIVEFSAAGVRHYVDAKGTLSAGRQNS